MPRERTVIYPKLDPAKQGKHVPADEFSAGQDPKWALGYGAHHGRLPGSVGRGPRDRRGERITTTIAGDWNSDRSAGGVAPSSIACGKLPPCMAPDSSASCACETISPGVIGRDNPVPTREADPS